MSVFPIGSGRKRVHVVGIVEGRVCPAVEEGSHNRGIASERGNDERRLVGVRGEGIDVCTPRKQQVDQFQVSTLCSHVERVEPIARRGWRVDVSSSPQQQPRDGDEVCDGVGVEVCDGVGV